MDDTVQCAQYSQPEPKCPLRPTKMPVDVVTYRIKI